MSVTYGFYDSLNGDRKYNAKQISELFDGIIRDGVFRYIGDALAVSAGGGMSVIVGTGRAWFNHTWTYNDAPLILQVDQSEIALNRVDTVVLEVNSNIDVRANTIKIVKGVPSSEPVATELVRNEFVNQYPLAHIYVSAGATEITSADIENKIGSSDCPFVIGILVTPGDLLNLIEEHKAEDATSAHKPENVGVIIASKEEAEAGTNTTKYMTPLRVRNAMEAVEAGDNLIYYDTESGAGGDTTYFVKRKAVRVYARGSYRVFFTVKASGQHYTSYVRIYVNGSPKSSIISHPGSNYVEYSVDISGIELGDSIEWWGYTTTGTGDAARLYIDNVKLGINRGHDGVIKLL